MLLFTFDLLITQVNILRKRIRGPEVRLMSNSIDAPKPDAVPGYPFVTDSDVNKFLEDQLLTPKLDHLSSWLFLAATPKSSHISSLHHRRVRGCEVVVTEFARLHLVWTHNRIFIKSIPDYLTDEDFVEQHISNDPDLKKAMSGFLRSYASLIQCSQDLTIAREHDLIPQIFLDKKEGNTICPEKKEGNGGWKDEFVQFLKNTKVSWTKTSPPVPLRRLTSWPCEPLEYDF